MAAFALPASTVTEERTHVSRGRRRPVMSVDEEFFPPMVEREHDGAKRLTLFGEDILTVGTSVGGRLNAKYAD